MTFWSEATVDKASVFYDLTQRNALRRANGLPLLDIPAEYARQMSLGSHRMYQTICHEHAEEREVIRQQVLAEYRAKNSDFGNSPGGRWMVGFLTNKRFTAYMAQKYALSPPDRVASQHPIIYGLDRKGQVEGSRCDAGSGSDAAVPIVL